MVVSSMAMPVAATLLLAAALYGAAMLLHIRPLMCLAVAVTAPVFIIAAAFINGAIIPTSPQPPASSTAFRFAHLNMLVYTNSNQTKLAFVQSVQADILALVEVNQQLSASILATNPLPYHASTRQLADAPRLPMLLLSRWPITHVRSFGPRLQLYLINHPQTPFFVLQAHPDSPYTRTALANRNAQWASLVPNQLPYPLIIAGDFNTTPWDPATKHLFPTLTSGNNQPTWPSFAPLTPIDNILYSKTFKAPAITRLRVNGTDHLALIADFPSLPH